MNLESIRFGQHQDPIYYRKGTSDEVVISSILGGREYAFPALFEPKVILDIGANIGVAAILMATIYPTATIYSFEPVKTNYDILLKNTLRFENIKTFPFGLGLARARELMYESDDPNNHGGFSLHPLGINDKKSQLIDIVYSDDFLHEMGVKEIDLIKIDTEGAEYDILHSIKLHYVKYILGELHGVRDFSLMQYLEENGFSVGIQKTMHCRISKFCAEKLLK